MFSFFKWLLPAAAAMALVIGWSAQTAMAADATGKGTITGTVLDKDGKAVAGAEVRLMKPAARGGRQGGAANGAAPQQAAGGGGRNRPAPIATTKTDNDGKFTLKDVPVGDYRVATSVQDKGAAAAPATVTDGQTVDVKLTLKERPAGGGGGRRGGGGGAGGGQ